MQESNNATKLLIPSGIPLVGAIVPAGFPSPATDYIEDRFDLNELLITHPSATFLIRSEGDSMINAFIPPKAILLIDRALFPTNNDLVLAAINGEFTVKRYLVNVKGTYLAPANDKYKAIKVTEDMDFLVWGVVAHIIINTKDVK